MDEIKIKYLIEFHDGPYKGNTEEIIINLNDLEFYDLSGYLIEEGYLIHYDYNNVYFTVKNRSVISVTNIDIPL